MATDVSVTHALANTVVQTPLGAYYVCLVCKEMVKTLQFGGCVGMNHYMFGIGAYIQEHYVLDDDVRVRTISGSNYVGASMLSAFSVESIWELWSSRLDDMVKTRPWTGLYHMIAMTQGHMPSVLQPGSHSLERMKQHHIRIAVLDHQETIWAHDHTDLEDYTSAILAGAFIPGLCGRLWHWYRHQRCVDGGVRLPWTQSHASDPRHSTLSISVMDHPDLSWFRLAWMLVAGLWSRMPHLKMQYMLGYAYARDVLTPRLDTLLVRHPRRVLLPKISGHIHWDPVQKTFVI